MSAEGVVMLSSMTAACLCHFVFYDCSRPLSGLLWLQQSSDKGLISGQQLLQSGDDGVRCLLFRTINLSEDKVIPVKGAVTLNDGKVGFFQSIQVQAETSKCKPKCPSTSQNVQAQAETSIREPKRQSVSQNSKAWAKTSWRKPKRHGRSQNVIGIYINICP